MFTIFKNLVLLLIIVALLVGVGTVINLLIPWSWLVYLFILVRRLAIIFDFMIDTTTLFSLVGISFVVEISFWSVRAVLALFRSSGFSKS